MKRVTIFIIILSISTFLCSQCVIQLTDGDFESLYPQIHNGRVVWQGYDGNDYEIFFWDGTSTIQITDNEYDDVEPQIHDGQITWRGREDFHEAEIFLWNGEEIIQLTDNEVNDLGPQIHDGKVVWWQDGDDYPWWHVFFWDGTSLIQLTTDEEACTWDCSPRIHNGQVVWEGWSDIFLWDNGSVIQLSDENDQHGNHQPDIHNGEVVWVGGSGINRWNGETIRTLPIDWAVGELEINNGQVTWTSYPLCWECYSPEVHLWSEDSVETFKHADQPSLHNGMLTFHFTYSVYQILDSDIGLWDGSRTTRITNELEIGDWHPKIHNGQITWMRGVNSNVEIFVTCPRSHDRPVDRPGSDSDRDEPEELRLETIGSEVIK